MFKAIMKKNVSQTSAILQYMQQGKGITPLKAQHLFGAMRLADVVYRLKKKGHSITTDMCVDENGSLYAEYFLN